MISMSLIFRQKLNRTRLPNFEARRHLSASLANPRRENKGNPGVIAGSSGRRLIGAAPFPP